MTEANDLPMAPEPQPRPELNRNLNLVKNFDEHIESIC